MDSDLPETHLPGWKLCFMTHTFLWFQLNRGEAFPSPIGKTVSRMLLLSHFSRVRLCATPSPGFSRQEHWSGLPFPSPMHESEKWKWSRSSNSSWPHGLQPTRFLRPWDFPGKSTGVGCHRLLCSQGWKQVNKTRFPGHEWMRAWKVPGA